LINVATIVKLHSREEWIREYLHWRQSQWRSIGFAPGRCSHRTQSIVTLKAINGSFWKAEVFLVQGDNVVRLLLTSARTFGKESTYAAQRLATFVGEQRRKPSAVKCIIA